MKEREFEGRDLEEAIHAASRALGIPDADLHYRIVEQGRRGLLGIGARAVRIQVLPPVEPPPDPLAGTDLRIDAALDAPEPDEAPPARPAPRAAPRPGRPSSPAPAPQPAAPAPRTPAEPAGDSAVDIAATVNRMLELAGIEMHARAFDAEGEVRVLLDGPDRQLLHQKDADLAAAFQFLLNRMARRSWPAAGRIVVQRGDGEHPRRDDELTAMAHEAAEFVERTGRPRRLPPMNAYERRLIHLTIREYDTLDSRSEGQGHLKRVRVVRRTD